MREVNDALLIIGLTMCQEGLEVGLYCFSNLILVNSWIGANINDLKHFHLNLKRHSIRATCCGFILSNRRSSPGARPGYLSLPRYFFANLSICSSASLPLICSMTFPLTLTM